MPRAGSCHRRSRAVSHFLLDPVDTQLFGKTIERWRRKATGLKDGNPRIAGPPKHKGLVPVILMRPPTASMFLRCPQINPFFIPRPTIVLRYSLPRMTGIGFSQVCKRQHAMRSKASAKLMRSMNTAIVLRNQVSEDLIKLAAQLISQAREPDLPGWR